MLCFYLTVLALRVSFVGLRNPNKLVKNSEEHENVGYSTNWTIFVYHLII